MFLHNYTFHLDFPVFLSIGFVIGSDDFLNFLSICCMSPFSFLILLIWIRSLWPLVSLCKGLSILLVFTNNQLLVWLILCIFLFVSTWLISALCLIIHCLLLLLGIFASFCSRTFRCAVMLLVYALCSFFLEAFRVMGFPISTVFIVSHKFGYIVPSFSLNSKMSLISFFLSSLTKLSLSRMLFSFHVYVGFLLFLLLLKTSLSPWRSDRVHAWDYSNLLISVEVCFVSKASIWLLLEKVPWGAGKKVYSFVLGQNVL